MSCKLCDEAQDLAKHNEDEPECYVRVGNGNVRLIGCQSHLKSLLDIYRSGLGVN